ncbi:Uncharacterized protein M6B38_221035 [Iris pallida]|uniref:DUF7148 domain-containing protein n=1 Tax=Iris pallida TaxID=29817 RepID=A0AAX6DYR5_IRIPA|nr:Uncharacterized protein M6B38_221035 [Iris pallida]
MAVARQLLLQSPRTGISTPAPPPPPRARSSVVVALVLSGTSPSSNSNNNNKLRMASGRKDVALRTSSPVRASANSDGIVPAVDDGEDGVSLGTMKLAPNIDIPRFETLLFQWANSLCQGANLPLPVPLKVDKIDGGARLGFVAVDDGKTEVCVYIDCLVFPATGSSGPLFRAVRNGPMKDQPAPGEPRIMRSLLPALQKCAEIARV